jgi:hypothetical protein
VQALERSGWNQTKAAAMLGLNRDQILSLLVAGVGPPWPLESAWCPGSIEADPPDIRQRRALDIF